MSEAVKIVITHNNRFAGSYISTRKVYQDSAGQFVKLYSPKVKLYIKRDEFGKPSAELKYNI